MSLRVLLSHQVQMLVEAAIRLPRCLHTNQPEEPTIKPLQRRENREAFIVIVIVIVIVYCIQRNHEFR